MRIETIGNARLYLGRCEEILPGLELDAHAIVTDPPYGLRFMSQKWDYQVPTVEQWAACLNAIKPGGHLLAFAGTRTQHRMAVNIEDAGFDIRDMLAWVYSTGFPKSLDVGKAIDKLAGADRAVVGERDTRHGASRIFAQDEWSKEKFAPSVPITTPATEDAQTWDGWGTALKPALEPITLARRRLEGTVAQNVLAYGTGGLNIDGCRIGIDDQSDTRGLNGGAKRHPIDRDRTDGWGMNSGGAYGQPVATGRWPANLVHDGSNEVVDVFPDRTTHRDNRVVRHGKVYGNGTGPTGPNTIRGYDERGSAARFFYCAKASQQERGPDNPCPTVKPLALMRWLCTLVSAPGQLILDPFMGSGSTGIAAHVLGRRFVGIEQKPEHFDNACERLARAYAEPLQLEMDGLSG